MILTISPPKSDLNKIAAEEKYIFQINSENYETSSDRSKFKKNNNVDMLKNLTKRDSKVIIKPEFLRKKTDEKLTKNLEPNDNIQANVSKRKSSKSIITSFNDLSYFKKSEYKKLIPYAQSQFNNNSIGKSEIVKGIIKAREDLKVKKSTISVIDQQNKNKSPENLINIHKVFTKRDTFNNEKYSKDEIKQMLHKIFMLNSKYSKEKNDNLICLNKLNQLFKEMKILEKSGISASKLELIIKYNTNSISLITFDQFLNIFTTLCSEIYLNYDDNPLLQITNFANDFLLPVYNNMELSIFEKITKENILEDSTISYMKDIYSAIHIIYTHYFYFEVNKFNDKEKIKSDSINSFLLFCKDFEIMPYILNQVQIINYFNLLKPQNILFKLNLGKVFTLSNFFISIYHFSIYYYLQQHQSPQANVTNLDKMIMFLEKLSITNGFENFEMRFNIKLKESFTFFPDEYESKKYNLKKNKLLIDKRQVNSTSTKYFDSIDTLTNVSIVMQNILSENQHFSILKEIFQAYCKFGKQTNCINYMNLTGWIAFLKDAHILNTNNFQIVNKNNAISNNGGQSNRTISSQKEKRIKIRRSSVITKKKSVKGLGFINNSNKDLIIDKNFVEKAKEKTLKVIPISTKIVISSKDIPQVVNKKISNNKLTKVTTKNEMYTKSLNQVNLQETEESLYYEYTDENKVTLTKITLIFQNLISKNKQEKQSDNNRLIDYSLSKDKEVLSKINFEGFIIGIEKLAILKYGNKDIFTEEAINLLFENDLLLIINQFSFKFLNRHNKNYMSRQFESLLNYVESKYDYIIRELLSLTFINLSLIFNNKDQTHQNYKKQLITNNKLTRKNMNKINLSFDEYQLFLLKVGIFPSLISTSLIKDLFNICEINNSISLQDTCSSLLISGFIEQDNFMYTDEEKLFNVLSKIKESDFGIKVINSFGKLYKILNSLENKILGSKDYIKPLDYNNTVESNSNTVNGEEMKYINLKSSKRLFSNIK